MYKLPAFHDSHLHLLGLGYIESMIDLTTFKSIQDVTTIQSKKDIIQGRGWHQLQFKEQRQPTKQDLNLISRSKPVVFTRVCGHVLVCNDKAMEVAGISKYSSQVEGGSFDFDTGEFTEDAIHLIYSILPTPSKADIKEYLIRGNDILLSNGITRCGSDDFSTLNVPYELVLSCLEEVYHDQLMQVELYEQVNLPSIELLQDFISKGYHKKTYQGFRMGPLKLLADGSLGGRTAWMKADYADDPGNQGIQVFDDDTLFDLIHLADSNDMDVAIHAIGDQTMDQVLNAIEKSLLITKRDTHRHSIIHAQLATSLQIERMKQLGISAIVQPIFLNSDIPIITSRLGEQRTQDCYLFHSMYQLGIHLGLSTDAPVESVNPFTNLFTALSRQSIQFPNTAPHLPKESFQLEEALHCYTTANDWINRFEPSTDYILVDKDIHSLDIKGIRSIKVLQTIMRNKVVFDKNTQIGDSKYGT